MMLNDVEERALQVSHLFCGYGCLKGFPVF